MILAAEPEAGLHKALRDSNLRKSGRALIAVVGLMALVTAGCGPRGDREARLGSASGNQQEAPAAGQSGQGSPGAIQGETPGQGNSQPASGTGAEVSGSAAPSGAGTAKAAPRGAAAAPGGPAASGGATGRPSAAASASPGAPVPGGPGTPAPGSPGAPAPGGAAPGPGQGQPSGPANLSPVAIGSVCECSGPVGASLGAGIPMAQVTARYINENGGLNGHPIKLLVGDSGSDPNRYFALVKQMVERDGVIAFMGQMSPLTVNAGDAYLREKGIPVVGGDGAHAVWFQSPVLFFAGPSYGTMAVADAKHAASIGKPKIGLMFCAEAQPCQMYRDALHGPLMAKTGGAEIVYEAKVSLAQPDFTSECLQAQSRGAQSVFAIVDANAAERLTRSCSQQGFTPQYYTSPLTFTNAVLGDPNMNGMIAAVATFPWFANDFPAAQQYQAAVRKYKPGMDLSATASAVWVSGQMMLAATKNLPAQNPTSQDIMRGVWSIKATDFGGLVSSPASWPQGQPSKDDNCYFLTQIKDGKYVAPAGTKPQCL